jgi:hypothetical protein
MKITVEMPDIQACNVASCAYNLDLSCHARAITVGEGIHAACDTFFVSPAHTHDASHVAGVGACKVTGCRHNADFECAAHSISVAMHEDHADCMTFAPR